MRTALCAQSKSQKSERMKKMMKKFLSSLLALTMILSLVIVPANAAVGDDKIAGVSRDTPTVTLKKYGSHDVTFNYPAEPNLSDAVTVNGKTTYYYKNYNVKVYSDDMSVAMVSFTHGSSKVTIQSVGKEGTANIKYTVSFMAQNASAPYLVTQTLTTTVTVKSDKPTEPEKPEVTAASGVVTVSTTETNVKEGDDVTFSVIAKIKDSNNEEHNATVTDATWSHNGKFDKAKGTLTVKAPASDFAVSATGIKLTASDNSNLSLDDSAKIKVNASKVSVTSNQSEANKAFDTAVKAAKAFTYNSRPATLTGSTISYIAYAGDSKTGTRCNWFFGYD